MLGRVSAFSLAFHTISVVGLLYIAIPLLVIVIAPLGDTGFVQFPPQGLTLKWYVAALHDGRYLASALTSLKIACLTTVASGVIGIMTAFGLSRRAFLGSALLEQLFLSPLILPGLVLAVALTQFFAHIGWQADTARLVLAHTLACTPFVIRVALPLFRQYDQSLDEAALSLGASHLAAFFLVFLPVVKTGVVSGCAIAFIMSFDELVLTLFLGHPSEPTLPVMMYSSVLMGFNPVVAAVSGLLILAATTLLILSEFIGGRRRRA